MRENRQRGRRATRCKRWEATTSLVLIPSADKVTEQNGDYTPGADINYSSDSPSIRPCRTDARTDARTDDVDTVSPRLCRTRQRGCISSIQSAGRAISAEIRCRLVRSRGSSTRLIGLDGTTLKKALRSRNRERMAVPSRRMSHEW